MTDKKIGNFEAVAIIVIVIINQIILNSPQRIIQSTLSGAIFNTVFISLVAFLVVFLICKLLKNFPGLDILDISNYLGGKWLKVLIGILFTVYLLFVVSVVVRTFSEILKIIFFPRTPVQIIIILFLLTVIIVHKLGLAPIARGALYFLPIVLATILFIFVINFEHFNVHRIFPLLGNGVIPTFLSGLSNIYAFSGIGYLYLISPYIKEHKDYLKISFISVGISAIFLLISVATVLFMFPFATSNEEISGLYLAAHFIQFGMFFQRLDTFFVFIWIISMAAYLCIDFYFITTVFQKTLKLKYNKWIIGLFCSLCFGLCLLPQNMHELVVLESTVYKYSVLGLFFGFTPLILVLANLKHHFSKAK